MPWTLWVLGEPRMAVRGHQPGCVAAPALSAHRRGVVLAGTAVTVLKYSTGEHCVDTATGAGGLGWG